MLFAFAYATRHVYDSVGDVERSEFSAKCEQVVELDLKYGSVVSSKKKKKLRKER